MKKLILLIAALLAIGMPSFIFAQEKPLLVKKFSKQQYERIFSGAYLSGAVNTQITFIEVMDPECPFCFSQHQSGILQRFAQRKDVNFMSVGVQGVNHTNTEVKIRGLICAGEFGGKDGYYRLYHQLMESSPNSSDEYPNFAIKTEKQFLDVIQKNGWNQNDFVACVEGNTAGERYKNDTDFFQNELKIQGTPTTIVLHNPSRRYILIPGAQDKKSFERAFKRLYKKTSPRRF